MGGVSETLGLVCEHQRPSRRSRDCCRLKIAELAFTVSQRATDANDLAALVIGGQREVAAEPVDEKHRVDRRRLSNKVSCLGQCRWLPTG